MGLPGPGSGHDCYAAGVRVTMVEASNVGVREGSEPEGDVGVDDGTSAVEVEGGTDERGVGDGEGTM